MPDWILFLTGLAIYIGALIGILFQGVLPEIRAIRRDKDDFRKSYQDKVPVLQGKAEVALIEAISKAEQLHQVFGRPLSDPANANPPSAGERDKMNAEIGSITASIRDVTEPKELFTRVLKDFDVKSDSLGKFSLRVFLLSLLIPLNALSYSLFSAQMANALALASGFVGLMALLPLIPYWSSYSSASARLESDQSKLANAVTQRIFLPPPGPADTPPATPP